MRKVSYARSEYLIPWKWRKTDSLHHFILEIPDALYFSIVPGRVALNEVLRSGSSGGGMDTEMSWAPFELSEDDYREVTEFWTSVDLRKILRWRTKDAPDLSFVFDREILEVPGHLDYLRRSAEKYQSRFLKQVDR